MHITARGCEVDLRAEGKIEFNADFTDIAHLSPGGSFHVTVLRAGVRHELTLTERNGSLDRTWRIDGHDHAYDAEAQRWLADFLVEVDRQTAMGVDYRLPALLKQGGVAAVLKETALMSGDYPRSVYYRKLSETTKLTNADLVAMLDQAATHATSDYYSSIILRSFASQETGDPAVHAAAFRLLDTIKSDYYLVESVKGLVVPGRATTTDLDFLVRVAGRVSSAYYKLAMIKDVTSGGHITDAQRVDLARIVGMMREDYYIDEVIRRLAQQGPLSPASTRALLAAADQIGSDHYKVSALKALLEDSSLHEADLLEIVDATHHVSSDYYKADALKTIARHPATTARVDQAVRDVADGLSDYRDDVRRAAGR